MSHEQSETVEQDGQWVNVYGKATPRAGEILPDSQPWLSEEDAVGSAQDRSRLYLPPLTGFTERPSALLDLAAPPLGLPPAPPSDLSAVAQSAMGNVEKTQGAYSDALTKRAETFKPQVEAIKKAGQEFSTKAAESVVKPPTLPPPPSRKLHDYLQPSEGQTPEHTVASLISAIGLFATGATALAKRNARTSLSALTGALKGWQEGDAEKGDREFEKWKAETKTLLTSWETQRSEWEDWFKAGKLSLDQQNKGLELAMMQAGFDLEPGKVAAEGAKYLMERIDKQQTHADAIALQRDQLERQREAQRSTDEYRKAHLGIEQGKRADAKAAAEHTAEQFTPEVLTSLGQQWALTGKIPALGALGKAGAGIRGKIVEAGIAWTKERGVNPQELPAIQAEVAAAKSGLTKVTGQNAVAMANVRNFEKHMDSLLTLSAKVDRTGVPVINRVILKAKGQYQGDADVAAYEAQSYEVAMEFSKVMVGSAQGDASTRDEARKTINGALTHEQLTAVANQLRMNAENRLKSYRETEKELSGVVDSAAGRIEPPPGKAPASAAPKSNDGWTIKRLD